MKKITKIIVRFLINNFLSGTRFFFLKRNLLNYIGIKIGDGTKIVGPINFGTAIDIRIGTNCWIGSNCNFDGNGEIIIGNNIDIAPHVVINTGGHLIGSSERRAGKGIATRINIKDGSWLGTNVTIINNTTISEGCVVAAGSTVIKNIPKNVLVTGIPAKIKRKLN